jgi:hypothetical protein
MGKFTQKYAIVKNRLPQLNVKEYRITLVTIKQYYQEDIASA